MVKNINPNRPAEHHSGDLVVKMKKVYPIKLESDTISDLKEIAESVGSNPNKVAREFIESGVKKFKKTGKI